MRHPGSGPQHTLSPQPSLTDGRGERLGGGRGRRGSGGCILTIPRSILSSLNLPSFLPSLYPIYPFSFSSQPLLYCSYFSILSVSPPYNSSSSPTFVYSSSTLSTLLLPPFLPPHMLCCVTRFNSPASGLETPSEKKNYTCRRQGSGRQAVPLVKVPDLG